MGHKEVLMTQLRRMMLVELQRRNYSKQTSRYYLLARESTGLARLQGASARPNGTGDGCGWQLA